MNLAFVVPDLDEECEERRALEGVKVRNCVKQYCRRRLVLWGRVKECGALKRAGMKGKGRAK